MYEYLYQIPEEYQHLIKKLIKEGTIKQDADMRINISEDVFQVILILSRLDLL